MSALPQVGDTIIFGDDTDHLAEVVAEPLPAAPRAAWAIPVRYLTACPSGCHTENDTWFIPGDLVDQIQKVEVTA